MNDRFKFRVWDKENKCMHYPTRYSNFNIVNGVIVKIDSYLTGNGVYRGKRVAYEFDDAVLMQCTGLKDKNGRLIYEGDIVNQIYEDETTYKCEVVYNNCSFQLKHIEDKNKNYINTPMYCYAINYLGHYTEKRLEVIGNIYENPELLTDQERTEIAEILK